MLLKGVEGGGETPKNIPAKLRCRDLFFRAIYRGGGFPPPPSFLMIMQEIRSELPKRGISREITTDIAGNVSKALTCCFPK